MIRTLLAAAVLATTASVANASSRTMVGKWDCIARDGKHLAIAMLLDYRQSGHFYHLANVAAGDRRGRLDASIALRGRWFRDHGKLTETIRTSRLRSIAVDGTDISVPPSAVKWPAPCHAKWAAPPTPASHGYNFSPATRCNCAAAA